MSCDQRFTLCMPMDSIETKTILEIRLVYKLLNNSIIAVNDK